MQRLCRRSPTFLSDARHFPHNNEMCHKWHPRVARMEIGAQCASCLPVPILCLHLTVFFRKRAFGAVAGAVLFVSLARPPPISWRPSFHSIRFLFESNFAFSSRNFCLPSMAFNSRNLFTVQFQFLVIRLLRFSAVDRTREYGRSRNIRTRWGDRTAQLMFIYIFLLLVSSFLTSLSSIQFKTVQVVYARLSFRLLRCRSSYSDWWHHAECLINHYCVMLVFGSRLNHFSHSPSIAD